MIPRVKPSAMALLLRMRGTTWGDDGGIQGEAAVAKIQTRTGKNKEPPWECLGRRR